MRIATWNVNGLRARLDYLRLWLEARRPDVVGLQELKLTDERFPHAELAGLGYHAAVYGQKAWNGVAVLARTEPRPLQLGLPGEDHFGARLLTVEVGGLAFTTVYCPNGKSVDHDDYPRKLEWFDSLSRHLATTLDSTAPAVLCGDFNVVPAPLDSWDEERLAGSIFHTGDERRRLEALLEHGLVDLFRRRHPHAREFTWWDYRGGAFHRGHGLRIDLVLGTEPVAARLAEAEIDRDWRKKQDGLTPSDHAPVLVDLDLSG